MSKLPDNLQVIVENMTPFQRKYCEYRAKGLKQAAAAAKAGSSSEDKTNLGRVGYQVEQMVGYKDYILWLQQERAKVAMIDEIEIIDKLRRIYDQAMTIDKLKEANTSVELMGNLIGLFGAKGIPMTTKEAEIENGTANNTGAFKDEGLEENETNERLAKLQQMMKDLNK